MEIKKIPYKVTILYWYGWEAVAVYADDKLVADYDVDSNTAVQIFQGLDVPTIVQIELPDEYYEPIEMEHIVNPMYLNLPLNGWPKKLSDIPVELLAEGKIFGG